MNAFLEPFKESILIKILLAIITFLFSLFSNVQVAKNSQFFKTLKAKDSIIFEKSPNGCKTEQLNIIIAQNFGFKNIID